MSLEEIVREALGKPTGYDRAQDERLTRLEQAVFGPAPTPPGPPAPAPAPAPPAPVAPSMTIALVNESTLVNNGAVAAWGLALAIQAEHVDASWHTGIVSVLTGISIHQVPTGAYPLVVLDNADQAGALGYHDVDPHGRPYGRAFVKDCTDNGVDPASCVSHEFCEILLDANCNTWETGPDGKQYAKEACDPVESGVYWITPDGHPTITVSDFVLPAYFDLHAGPDADVSYNGAKGPFAVQKGGYQIVRDASGKETEITADIIVGDDYPAWRQPGKLFAAARTLRRLV